MADAKISALNSLTKSTIATTDVLPIVDTSATETKKITYQELIQPTDANFRIAGSSDTTKLVAFEVDGLTTATTRTLTVPDANTTLVGTDTTQTLTNKTLTSPQINFGSDATGDQYQRSAGGVTVRVPIGSEGQIWAVQSGIGAWISNPSASDASTTVKGVVEEATLAETLARTGAGGTSARLFVNPTNLTTVLTYDYIASATGSDAYAITVAPAPTAYVTGQKFTFKADVANTGAATLNVNSLGAKTIKKNVTVDLATNDIIANSIVTVVYDGTNFQLDNGGISTTGNGDYAADYTVGSSAIQNSTQTHTITHNLGTIPRLINVTTQNVSTVGGGGASCSHGNATVDASGTILTQQVVTGYWLNGSTIRFNDSSIVMAHGNGVSVLGTIQNVTSTTFEIQWAATGNINGTPNYVWEVFA